MGCTQSMIENEEPVNRCKERKQYMREAVNTRNLFAAAHSAYTVSLKNTGAALLSYGEGEVLDLLPSKNHAQSPIVTLPPAPPPLPNFSQNPLQRATSMPEFSIPKYEPKPAEPIQEEDDEAEEIEDDEAYSHLIRRGSARTPEPETPQPPPSPPRTPPPPPPPPTNPDPPLPPESRDTPYDFFFSMDMPTSSLGDPNEIRHENKSSSSRAAYDDDDDPYRRMENVVNVDGGDVGSKGGNVEPQKVEKVVEVEPQKVEKVVEVEPEVVKPQPSKKSKQVVHSQAAASPNVNLLQVLIELDDDFLEACKSAYQVSKILEANRMHYHSNFADNRGHIDHSARVMRVITWNRSFSGMPNADDGKGDFDGEDETQATVLDKLLAWEKKLYDEVKAGELMKHEYQRKVALLDKKKKQGTNSESLEKTKAAVSHLHTKYIVDMQSLDSTVAEINRLRDDQLYPKLVELVDGLAKMWERMYVHHDKQMKFSANLKSLDISQAPKETSDQHHKQTEELWRVVQDWHTQFQKLVTHQKEYIRALNSWLKLNLIPTESSLNERVSSPSRVPQPPIQALLRAWNGHLEKLPDELTPISSFAAVVNTIMINQDEEFKLKEKCNDTRKELARKERAFTEWREKYMQRRTPPDEMEPEKGEDANYKDPVAERQFAVEALQKRLEDELETYQKHCMHVREKSLHTLKIHLPELFRALSEFAHSSSKMYKNLRSIAE